MDIKNKSKKGIDTEFIEGILNHNNYNNIIKVLENTDFFYYDGSQSEKTKKIYNGLLFPLFELIHSSNLKNYIEQQINIKKEGYTFLEEEFTPEEYNHIEESDKEGSIFMKTLFLVNKIAHAYENLERRLILEKYSGKLDNMLKKYNAEGDKLTKRDFLREIHMLLLEKDVENKVIKKEKYESIKDDLDTILNDPNVQKCTKGSEILMDKKNELIVSTINYLNSPDKEDDFLYTFGKMSAKDRNLEADNEKTFFVFDVPEHGQFSLHAKEEYNLIAIQNAPEYPGIFLHYDMPFLTKASREKIEKANKEELTAEEKQQYKIAKGEPAIESEREMLENKVINKLEVLNRLEKEVKKLKREKIKIKQVGRELKEKYERLKQECEEQAEDVSKIEEEKRQLKESIKRLKEEVKEINLPQEEQQQLEEEKEKLKRLSSKAISLKGIYTRRVAKKERQAEKIEENNTERISIGRQIKQNKKEANEVKEELKEKGVSEEVLNKIYDER